MALRPLLEYRGNYLGPCRHCGIRPKNAQFTFTPKYAYKPATAPGNNSTQPKYSSSLITTSSSSVCNSASDAIGSSRLCWSCGKSCQRCSSLATASMKPKHQPS